MTRREVIRLLGGLCLGSPILDALGVPSTKLFSFGADYGTGRDQGVWVVGEVDYVNRIATLIHVPADYPGDSQGVGRIKKVREPDIPRLSRIYPGAMMKQRENQWLTIPCGT